MFNKSLAKLTEANKRATEISLPVLSALEVKSMRFCFMHGTNLVWVLGSDEEAYRLNWQRRALRALLNKELETASLAVEGVKIDTERTMFYIKLEVRQLEENDYLKQLRELLRSDRNVIEEMLEAGSERPISLTRMADDVTRLLTKDICAADTESALMARFTQPRITTEANVSRFFQPQALLDYKRELIQRGSGEIRYQAYGVGDDGNILLQELRITARFRLLEFEGQLHRRVEVLGADRI